MEVLLPKFDYYLDESDPDVVVLTRQDDSFVAAFSAQMATSKAIVEAAEEDYRALIEAKPHTSWRLDKERPRDERALRPSGRPAPTRMLRFCAWRKNWCGMKDGRSSSSCCRRILLSPRAAGPACPTARDSPGLSSSSTRVYPG